MAVFSKDLARASFLGLATCLIPAGCGPNDADPAGTNGLSRTTSGRPTTSVGGGSEDEAPGIGGVDRESDEIILFFFDEGCPDCIIVLEELLPRLLELEGWPAGFVRRLDVTKPETLEMLLQLEERLGFRADPLAPVLVVRGRPHVGLDEIRKAVARSG